MDKRAAVLGGGRDAGADERDLDGQLLGHPDDEQVDVERPAADRMDLDAVHEHGAGRAPVDREVDQRGRAGPAAKQLELVGIERDGLDSVPWP